MSQVIVQMTDKQFYGQVIETQNKQTKGLEFQMLNTSPWTSQHVFKTGISASEGGHNLDRKSNPPDLTVCIKI